jgi:hypothetical protein
LFSKSNLGSTLRLGHFATSLHEVGLVLALTERYVALGCFIVELSTTPLALCSVIISLSLFRHSLTWIEIRSPATTITRVTHCRPELHALELPFWNLATNRFWLSWLLLGARSISLPCFFTKRLRVYIIIVHLGYLLSLSLLFCVELLSLFDKDFFANSYMFVVRVRVELAAAGWTLDSTSVVLFHKLFRNVIWDGVGVCLHGSKFVDA